MLNTSTTSALVRNLKMFMVVTVAAGCGGDKQPAIDAMPDMAPLTLDCSTYCSQIQMHCGGADAQYADVGHCMAACASFIVGTSTVDDMTGDTLGCRIYHAGAPSGMAPATHCPHAGPGGDLLTANPAQFCSGGNVCESFCALELKACGSLDAPLPGDPRDATNNHLFQFRNMNDCLLACAAYDKTHVYSTAATGDSLACRLLQATEAAIAVTPNAKLSCMNTGDIPRGPCVGTPSP
jgi:hypothetical protein